MPIYTYRCESCGVQFERQQSFTDQPLTRCPECNKKTLRKVYLPVGIVFKGKGFYATDHRSPSGASSHKEKDRDKEPTTKNSGSESKPTSSETTTTTSSKNEE
jgi:putative FmdB family regulatory protein